MPDKPTILLAEDEPSFRQIYRDVLEDKGYNVLEAVDGQIALDRMHEETPALLLLDIIMPKVDGFAVLKAMKEDPKLKAVPVIIFSVLGEKADITKGLQLGANDYVIKGMTSPREILEKIRVLMKQPATVLKEKPAPNIYHLRVAPNKADASMVIKEIGLENGFTCKKCGSELQLEMKHDTSQATGHWYASHFVCPACKTEY